MFFNQSPVTEAHTNMNLNNLLKQCKSNYQNNPNELFDLLPSCSDLSQVTLVSMTLTTAVLPPPNWLLLSGQIM